MNGEELTQRRGQMRVVGEIVLGNRRLTLATPQQGMLIDQLDHRLGVVEHRRLPLQIDVERAAVTVKPIIDLFTE